MSPTESPNPGTAPVLAVPGTVPWRVVLRDLALVTAWVAVVSVAFRTLGWPTWAYSVVVFGGVLGYSLAGGPWGSRGDG